MWYLFVAINDSDGDYAVFDDAVDNDAVVGVAVWGLISLI